ncbi:MAG: single-stranded DNA-binding protein, partial [Deltaproteobacteria bacterium]|nr:single-stranded DNA-binding protein [Deltaproteobacteria bacterium]
MSLLQITRDLRDAVARLHFGPPTAYVYNPLAYAWPPCEAYLARWGGAPREIVLLGMNPGPFGMAQTGVP